jgi:hypothetical protein
MHCGSVRLSWDQVGLFATYCELRSLSEWKNIFIIPSYTAIRAASILRDRSLHDGDPLTLVGRTTAFKTTDPRDRVYTLLGLPCFQNRLNLPIINY